MEVREAFGKALRLVRQRQGFVQEDFSLVSSRTFVSMLERGTTSPTVEKLDSLCKLLGVHPVTLLAVTYLLESEPPEGAEQLLRKVGDELRALMPQPPSN